MMPANIETIRETIQKITDVQIVEKETIDEEIVGPIFGTPEDNDEKSLITQVFQIFALVIILSILIFLIALCRKKLLPKCPSAIQGLAKMI